MKVRRKTFEQDLQEKEEAFLKLSGEERLSMMVKVSDRLRNKNAPATFKGLHVRIIRNP